MTSQEEEQEQEEGEDEEEGEEEEGGEGLHLGSPSLPEALPVLRVEASCLRLSETIKGGERWYLTPQQVSSAGGQLLRNTLH